MSTRMVPAGDMNGLSYKEGEEREIRREGVEQIEDEYNEDFKRIPPWTKQITVRGVIASILIGSVYSIIAMKLNLTTGITPNLNISAALLAFIFIRSWTKLLRKFGYVTTPFTKQENTMIQTCSVACYSIAIGGTFVTYHHKNTFFIFFSNARMINSTCGM